MQAAADVALLSNGLSDNTPNFSLRERIIGSTGLLRANAEGQWFASLQERNAEVGSDGDCHHYPS